MKKLILTLALALVAMVASAEFSVGQLKYEVLANGEVECKGFTSTALAQNPTSVFIPGSVKSQGTEYKVYSIAANAFKNCTSLKYMYADWGIVEIVHDAFSGCSALYSVRLPSTIKVIDTYAFYNCSSMSVFGIAATTVPTVASSAFTGMKKCNVHVATQAAVNAYNNSAYWRNIDLDGSVARTPNLAYDFVDNNRYYLIHTDRSVSNYNGKATLIGVESNVTYIPITSVTDNIPVTYGGCSSGYTVNITRIAPLACKGNTKITSVGRTDLGSTTGFELVGAQAFMNCTSLTLAGIPSGEIESEAFKGCTALSTVRLYSSYDIDNGVKKIGNSAFYNCTNLHELIVSYKGNIDFGEDAFGNNASDFKCYLPLYKFYYNYIRAEYWAEQCIHPFIIPKTEWTAISCYKPMLLPSSAQFYYVNGFTKGAQYVVAKTQQLIGSAAAATGLLMKATPGTIYRFTISATGASPTTNYLKGVREEDLENLEYLDISDSAGNYNYRFDSSTNIFNRLFYAADMRVYSGDAYLNYIIDGTNRPNSIFLEGVLEPYGVNINGIDVTNLNYTNLSAIEGVTGTITFNPSTKTLTLNNATTTGTISTYLNGIKIDVKGTNNVKVLYIGEQSYGVNETATITGGGTLNLENGMSCGCKLTINGETKISINGPQNASSSSLGYAIGQIFHRTTSYYDGWSMYADITISGSGTELYIDSRQGFEGPVVANSVTLCDGLYVAKPRGAQFNSNLRHFIDANGHEITNAELLIKGGSRGFKVDGVWYEYSADFGGCAKVIEPQLGEDYIGEVDIPKQVTNNGNTYTVRVVESGAFSGTKVTRVDLPNTVERIESNAFKDAKQLKTLVIGYTYPPSYVSYANDFASGNASEFTCYVTNRYLTKYMETFSNINFAPWVEFDNNVYQPFSSAISVKIGGTTPVLKAYMVNDFDVATRTAKTLLVNQNNNAYNIPSRMGLLLKGEPNTRYLLPTGTASQYSGTNNYLQPYVTVEDSPLNIQDDNARFYFNQNNKEWESTVNLYLGSSFLCVPKSMLGNDTTSPVHLDLEHTSSGLLGDLNGSGIVDVEDVNAAINIILKLKTMSDYPGNGDMDGNGMIDVEDVNAMINIILKL